MVNHICSINPRHALLHHAHSDYSQMWLECERFDNIFPIKKRSSRLKFGLDKIHKFYGEFPKEALRDSG